MKKVDKHRKKNIDYNRQIVNKFIEWLIYMVGYAIVLITVSMFFDSFYINNSYYGFYALLVTIIIYIFLTKP